ncbi:protein AGENET DOMAIN (AGD)-CONTAINING P1-like [Silene latifolia]|uniref:protein AGENET DOMAIN (AGD)-CONTAINING P1-like n=1 Tax=Silene latifolia TaxID=37657 RepID=UPI003D775A7D
MVHSYALGDIVEVCFPELGFLVTYFVACLLFEVEDDVFYVEFEDWFKPDGLRLHREVVAIEKIRPRPPHIQSSRFDGGDLAEVYFDGGWWLGRVLHVCAFPFYSYHVVLIDTFDEVVICELGQMRLHQVWEEERWVIVID